MTEIVLQIKPNVVQAFNARLNELNTGGAMGVGGTNIKEYLEYELNTYGEELLERLLGDT